MQSPFSADRLHQLAVVREWRPDQIAELAGAATGEPATAEDVLAWLANAGIVLARPRPDRDPGLQPRRTVGVKSARRAGTRRRRDGEGRITQPCDCGCGVLVTRVPSEVMAHVYASPECARAHRSTQARERRAERKRAPATEGVKICPECPPEKGPQPLSAFSVDVGRVGGRARICRACNKRKSKAYYRANQERLQAKARERDRRIRSAATAGGA